MGLSGSIRPGANRGLPRWGSLPATSREHRLASGLPLSWHNRKRASDLRGWSRVRPNGHFLSADPQSDPDTQELPPTPASGDQDGSLHRRLERHTWRTLEVERPSGSRSLRRQPVAYSVADIRPVTTGGAALRHHAAPTRGKGDGAPIRDLLGSANSGGFEGRAGASPSPAPLYDNGRWNTPKEKSRQEIT